MSCLHELGCFLFCLPFVNAQFMAVHLNITPLVPFFVYNLCLCIIYFSAFTVKSVKSSWSKHALLVACMPY